MTSRGAAACASSSLAIASLADVLCEMATLPTVVCRVDDDRVIAANDGLLRLLGWSRGDLELAPGGARSLFREGGEYESLQSELRASGELEGRAAVLATRRGEPLDAVLSAWTASDAGTPVVVVSVRDDVALASSDGGEAAAARRELSAVLRTVGDGVIATDGGGNVVSLNAVAERLTGWRSRDAIGRPLREVFRVVRPGRGANTPDPFSDVLNRRQDAASWPRAVLTARDETQREIAESVSGLRRRDGEGFGVLVVFRDVTAQSRLDSELQKNQRLEALGVLASGIAHDINNALTSVFGGLGIARAHTDDPAVVTRLAGAERATTSVRAMTRQLLSLARESEPQRTRASVRALLEDAVAIGLCGASSRADVQVEDEELTVDVDAAQISRVIQNLVLNAAHAMPDGGVVSVSASRVDGGDAGDDGGPAFVRIAVHDHGPGVPVEVRGRIFEPYFTTKDGGSGLGLAVAQSIVTHHGGWIDYVSAPGLGTTFEFYLPLLDDAVRGERPHAAFGEGRGLRVLFLEDDLTVADATLEMLDELGCRTAHDQSGEAALARFERARAAAGGEEPFDVLLMDLTVRGAMGGRACLARLRAAGCGAPSILTSGYADADDARWRRDGFDGALPKPYSLDELRRAIGSIARRPPSERSRA